MGVCHSPAAAGEGRDHVTGGLLMGVAFKDEAIPVID